MSQKITSSNEFEVVYHIEFGDIIYFFEFEHEFKLLIIRMIAILVTIILSC